MGDRITYFYDCPKCGAKEGVEVYDAPSCMMYVEMCQHCDFKVDLNYYEEAPNVLCLISKEEAKKRGYFCKNCASYLYPGYSRDMKLCEDCLEEQGEL